MLLERPDFKGFEGTGGVGGLDEGEMGGALGEPERDGGAASDSDPADAGNPDRVDAAQGAIPFANRWERYVDLLRSALDAAESSCLEEGTSLRKLSANDPVDASRLHRLLPALWARIDAANAELLDSAVPDPRLRELVVRRACARALSVFASEPVYSGLRVDFGLSLELLPGLLSGVHAGAPAAGAGPKLDAVERAGPLSPLQAPLAGSPELAAEVSKLLATWSAETTLLREAQIRERRSDRLREGRRVAEGDYESRIEWRSRELRRVRRWESHSRAFTDALLEAASRHGFRREALRWRADAWRAAWPGTVPARSAAGDLLAEARQREWLPPESLDALELTFLEQRDAHLRSLIDAVNRWQQSLRVKPQQHPQEWVEGTGDGGVLAARAAAQRSGERLTACELSTVQAVQGLLEATEPPAQTQRQEVQSRIRRALEDAASAAGEEGWAMLLDLFPDSPTAPAATDPADPPSAPRSTEERDGPDDTR